MRGYWVRIIGGALGVFAIGLGVWATFTAGKSKVEQVMESAVTLTIPLPFDLVPFQVDGDRLGSLKKLVIHRDGPREVNWVEIAAQLNDPDQLSDLADCSLSLDDIEDLDENTTFVCHEELPEGYTEFGEISFSGSDQSATLWVPNSLALDLRHADRSRIEERHARITERQLIIAEQQARVASKTSAQVAATVARAIAEAFADSIPAEVLAELKAAGVVIESAAPSSQDAGSNRIRVEVNTTQEAAPSPEASEH